ncbi:MAG: 4-hydroxybenzoate octaprenyltransferase [Natronospirillum sp.]|uniref:4-hydroxybenzoate octaprenyltransferase n=1 Tax=Natronospirillum sp. TaxID=2812955 RepID=UPI0025D06636|nr:4-hydroxybenzoate octaprenyltransferase [Natronospirillum sp.]MCH8551591.1 4-hydroxybenzoate octaprenyltransferase [Natronospirillum sp.]
MKWTQRLPLYLQLTRLNRPIGVYLLLWQTLWALWFAADGIPGLHTLLVFILGVIFMRSAGCVINDYADRHLDGHVKRTVDRPLVTGQVSEREALILAAVLVLVSFLLVLTTNLSTILWSFGAVGLAALYPFMKRHTHLPQLFLGLAFSWAIPMAYAAESMPVTPVTWVLFLSAVCWIMAYDTLYAMVDRDDDLKIGIRSTAILFGDFDRVAIGLLQGLFLLGMLLAGQMTGSGFAYYLGLLGAVVLFGYQHWLIRERERLPCFRAFLHNHWVGLVIFAGTVADRSLITLLLQSS